jgi:hypothetical protein
MADSDDTLKLLVELKALRSKDVEAAKGLLAETTTTAGELTKSAEALSNALKGPIAIASLGYDTYKFFQGKIDEMNAESDKQGAFNAKSQGAGVVGVQQAWDSAAESLGKYKAAFNTAGDDNDPIGTEIKRTKELTATKIEGEKKVVEASGKQEEDKLRQDNASPGQISAAAAQTQAKLAALDEKERVATGSGALTQEQTTRAALNDKLQREAAAAADIARQATVKHNNDAVFLANARDALGVGPEGKNSEAALALQKKVDDADAKLFAAQNEPLSYNQTTGGPPIDNRAARAKDILEAQSAVTQAQGELNERKQQVSEGEAKEAVRNAVYELAQKAAKDAQDASVHNQQRLGQLPDEIQHARDVEKIQRDAAAQVQAATVQANASGTAGGAGVSSAGRWGGSNEKDPGIDRLNTLLSTINANQQAMLALMNSFVDSEDRIAQQIESLTSKHTTIQRQIYHLQRTGNK